MIVAGSASPLLLSSAGGYNLTKSLRFRSSASAYLNRTPASASNRQTWTWSMWVKRGSLGSAQNIFAANGTTDTTYLDIRFTSSDTLQVGVYTNIVLVTTQVFRDPSAWYHIVWLFDTTQASASNRCRLFVNGTEITAFSTDSRSTYFAQNTNYGINNNTLHEICRNPSDSSKFFDGYLAEVNFIDGQALTPSSFGQTSTTTGVWIPKKYTGTYGTNGFYLPFTNTTSTSTLGNDFSGNSNTWTVNNISLTSGSTYDSMNDVPTLTSATTANYCTFNPVAQASSQPTFSNGNLNLSASSAWNGSVGTIGVTSGKWYWEAINGNSDSFIGICGSNLVLTTADPQTLTGTIVYYGGNGDKRVDGSLTSYGANYSTETIGVALDIDGGTVTFYKNNASQGSISLSSSTLNGKTIFPFFVKYASTTTVNFGQRPFAYTPPTGFKALNTFNLPTPTIGATASTTANEYFDATTYTGTGSTQNITNSGSMQPDWVWIKNRSSTNSHQLTDSVRGVNLALASDLTIAEFAGNINAFNTNGFQVTGASNAVNASGQTYVGWQWRASNATAVTNTAGSITSTVSANTTAGFSIVTYTGTGSNATVGHGLGVAPKMIITKSRNDSTYGWTTYNESIGAGNIIFLNTTSASTSAVNAWNNTAPTSSVFSLGTDQYANFSSKTYVAYCFAQVAGYSAFGSYTGNGSTDGPFIYTGFRPKYWLIKRTDSADYWVTDNSVTSPYNLTSKYLLPNTADAEGDTGSNPAGQAMDVLSNGFKLRNTNSGRNASGGTYIYMAFAENPFKYANAR